MFKNRNSSEIPQIISYGALRPAERESNKQKFLYDVFEVLKVDLYENFKFAI